MSSENKSGIRDLGVMDGAEKKEELSFGIRRSVGMEIEQFTAQAITGHHGHVLCVDASDGLEYVFSGGEDCTARLWKFTQEDFHCYRLHHVLDHCFCTHCEHGVLSGFAVYTPKVYCKSCLKEYSLHPELHEKRPAITSVAFAGKTGPAISVTRLGSLHITDVDLRSHARFQVFQDSITDVRVKRDKYISENVDVDSDFVWLLSIISGKIAGLYEVSRDPNEAHYSYELKACFPHDEFVKHAEHLPGDFHHGAALVTSTESCLTAWSFRGEKLQTFDYPGRHFTCLRISRANDGWSWMIASNTEQNSSAESGEYHRLSFWPVKHGIIVPEGVRPEEWPLEYSTGIKHEVSSFTVAHTNDYVMVQYKKNSDFIQIAPTDDDKRYNDSMSSLLVSIDNCPNMLFKEDVGNYLLSIPHKYHCNEMVMREDYDEDDTDDGVPHFSLSAVLAFEDGSVGIWDLQGDDRGQQTSAMRSLSTMEMIMPLALRFVSFAQVITFAFGPSTKFSSDVQAPISMSSKLAQFEFLEQLMPHVSMADLFLPELGFAMSLAAVYVFLAATGTPQVLAHFRMKVSHSSSGKGSYHSVVKMFSHFLLSLHGLISLLLGTCATILVVPMFKIFTKVVDCEMHGDVKVLSANPDIVCFGDFHLKLVGACSVLLPIYLITLLPYAVVSGNPEFVVRSDLLSPRQWRIHAERQACQVYHGALHPKTESVFITRVFELCIKILMPTIVILTTSYPLFQTVSIFACGLGGYVIALVKKPLVDRVLNAIIVGGQLFTALCMFCGIVTVVVPSSREYSIVLLLVSLLCSVLVSCYTIPPAARVGKNGKATLDLLHSYSRLRLVDP